MIASTLVLEQMSFRGALHMSLFAIYLILIFVP